MLTLGSPTLPSPLRTPTAVTEKAEVGRGWGRGGEGVTTGSTRAGSAAGATALITFGYLPKASGKDTGCDPWPAPGFKG